MTRCMSPMKLAFCFLAAVATVFTSAGSAFARPDPANSAGRVEHTIPTDKDTKANAGQPVVQVRDCVTINGGTYMITPGYWTRDGAHIGTTWIGGGQITGAGTVYSFANLKVRPNDFHYGAQPPPNHGLPGPPDMYTQANGKKTNIRSWTFWIGGFELIPPTDQVLPIFGGTAAQGPASIDVETTYNISSGAPNNPNLLLKLNGSTIYNNPLAGLAGSGVLAANNLEQIGVHAVSVLNNIPTVSQWGLIGMGLLLLTGGTLALRYWAVRPVAQLQGA